MIRSEGFILPKTTAGAPRVPGFGGSSFMSFQNFSPTLLPLTQSQNRVESPLPRHLVTSVPGPNLNNKGGEEGEGLVSFDRVKCSS